MEHSRTKQRIVFGLAAVALATVVMVAFLEARAQAAAASGGPDADSPSKSTQLLQAETALQQRRKQIEQAEREIEQAKDRMLRMLFERIKSIKTRQGLTPKEAVAFDNAYAAEMARINQAQQRLNAARQELATREMVVQRAGVAFVKEADVLARLEALERRVAALESAIGD